MHDEVSETENIRKNLAIERMIVEGCDILLDVNQVFVRQGSLIQIPVDKHKVQWNRISSFKSEKEAVRQCFLFTNHMLLTTRTSGGRLHLVPNVGKIPLSDAILIEDPGEGQDEDGESSSGSMSSQSSDSPAQSSSKNVAYHQNLDFKLIVDCKGGPPTIVHLAAATMQEKAAWISDISHCMDNVHFNDLFHNANNDTSSVTMPQCIRNDPKLFKDDVDIRFSRTLNSCKVPQIRYATPKRLLERLTDLRFLSIDFLNTFMLTYRVFTDGISVLEALKKVYYNPEVRDYPDSRHNSIASLGGLEVCLPAGDQYGRLSVTSVLSWDSDCNFRRISTASCPSEIYDREREHSLGHASHFSTGSCGPHWKYTHRKYEEELSKMPRDMLSTSSPAGSSLFHSTMATTSHLATSVANSALFSVSAIPAVPTAAAAMAAVVTSPISPGFPYPSVPPAPPPSPGAAFKRFDEADYHEAGKYLNIPKAMVASMSSETLTEPTTSAPSSPSSVTTMNTSTHTLVGTEVVDTEHRVNFEVPEVQRTPPASPKVKSSDKSTPTKQTKQEKKEHKKEMKAMKGNLKLKEKEISLSVPTLHSSLKTPTVVRISAPPGSKEDVEVIDIQLLDRHRKSTSSTCSASFSTGTSNGQSPFLLARRSVSKRGSGDTSDSSFYTPRGSFLSSDSPQHSSKAGVVVTSSRPSQRRSSTSSAAAAFAVATAGCSNPRDQLSPPQRTTRFLSAGNTDIRYCTAKRDSMMNSAATMRVLRVLRHWVSKHYQDFESNPELKQMANEFLEELVGNVHLLPAEHKAAAQLLQMMTREDNSTTNVDLDMLLAPPMTPSTENIESLSALEIAEQMTLLDHKIFISIQSEEFLGQAWMKSDKTRKTPNILLITKRFNDVSRLVVSEIIRRTNMASRITVIEKWAAVADICRCLHNFNGVLQICAAFVNSSVFRLKKTWEKVSKTTRQTVDKLQTLVSSDGRFRNLREALHRCDPPCIPYLGMYLTDLSFIEEGTPNFTEDGLLNFSKMRMIAHVIREIRHFQQTAYKIEMSPKSSNAFQYSTFLLTSVWIKLN